MSIAHIIQHWPRCIAYLFVEWVELHRAEHTDDHNPCLACLAYQRRKADSHMPTIGPQSEYCSKCGLPVSKWPPLCANRVVQINNKQATQSPSLLRRLFWED